MSRKHVSGTTTWVGKLQSGAEQILGVRLREDQETLFAKYLALIQKWQRVQRLVGSSDPGWIVDHLVLDSLLFARAGPPLGPEVLDFGSGAGFPGVPLSIALPDLSVTLVEGRAKRASFLRAVVRELALPGLSVRGARAETLVPDLAGSFDTVLAKCAGPPTGVIEQALGFLRPGGSLVVSSGPEAGTSIQEGPEKNIGRGWRVQTRTVAGPAGTRTFLIVSI